VPQPVLKSQRFEALGQPSEFSAGPLAIEGMKERFQGVTDQICFGPAEGGCPCRVDAEKLAFRIRHREQVLRDVPDAGAFPCLRLDALLQGFGKLAKPCLACGQRGLGALAFGDLLGNHIDADDGALRTPRRMPAGKPESLSIGAGRPLPVDLDAGDGLAVAQDELNDFLDLIGDLRHCLAHRPPDVVGERDPADFRQALVDPQIAAIPSEECKSDRGGIVINRSSGSWPDKSSGRSAPGEPDKID
jgi:hypothetical protein